MAKIWGPNGLIEMNDEQTERISEAVRDYMDSPEDYSYEDLEELFEDRDPLEFL